ncbi:MAG: SRPBCC family protein [Rubrivivax sp.]|nr:SRPBCC family protein [Rubrivivax sp.]MDH5340308.1 SRPBCC family protein [Rubrivivax sp.]
MHALSLRRFAAIALTLGLSLPAAAHGPTRQKVVEEVSVNAPAAKVWALIGNFDALAQWHPAVEASPADKGNEVGAVREVKLKGGGSLTETLQGHDDAGMTYKYRAKDGGALPVTNYTSSIAVRDEGGHAVVVWRGAFYRGYPNNDPPPELNDEAAIAAITNVYKTGLAQIKTLAERP